MKVISKCEKEKAEAYRVIKVFTIAFNKVFIISLNEFRFKLFLDQ